MSDDSDEEKTQEPTPERLKKLREDGQVPISQDLLVAASYMGVLIAFYFTGHSAIVEIGTVMMSFLDQSHSLAPLFFGDASTASLSGAVISDVFLAILPWFLFPAVLAILAMFAQNALVLAPKRIEPKLSKFNVIKNFQNKFNRAAMFDFAKNLFKMTVYAISLGLYLKLRLPSMLAVVGTGAEIVLPFIAQLALEFLFIALLISATIGIVDAAYQKAEFIRKNMMSFKDLKDEVKSSEGDAHVKAQRKQKGQAIIKKQLKQSVAKADVIIVNPTHYAVALEWDRLPGSAPICVAKGVDEIAAVIREIANENGIPIHSDPPTARALYATVEIGREIEETHYAPVAAAIRFAEEMRKRAKGQDW